MKLPKSLQSRKFWLSAVGVIAGVILSVYGLITGDNLYTDRGVNLIMLSIGAYVAAEGTADAITRVKQGEIDKIQKLADVELQADEVAAKADTDPDRSIVNGSEV